MAGHTDGERIIAYMEQQRTHKEKRDRQAARVGLTAPVLVIGVPVGWVIWGTVGALIALLAFITLVIVAVRSS